MVASNSDVYMLDYLSNSEEEGEGLFGEEK
jgi:hypothetical protein